MNKSMEESNLTRRNFLKLAAGGLVGAGALTLGVRPWTRDASAVANTLTRPAMGTFVEITGVGEGKDRLTDALDSAFSRIDEVDRTMSVFDEGSDVYRINAPTNRRLSLTPGLTEVLDSSLEISRITGGSFDVTSAPLLDLWGYYSGKLNVPDKSTLEATRKLVDYTALDLDLDVNVLTLGSSSQAVDLGGVAKGYAVDQAVEALKEAGLTGGLVNAGGDIRGFGGPADGSDWTVGLQNPKAEDDILHALTLSLPAITTSGDYESFFTYRGDRLSHIVDPLTGRPVEDVLSVSVMTNSATYADGLSTGLFSADPHRAVEIVNSLESTELIYVHRDAGEVKVKLSSGLKDEVNVGRMEMRLN